MDVRVLYFIEIKDLTSQPLSICPVVVGYDLVGHRDPCGYYLVGGVGYDFVGYDLAGYDFVWLRIYMVTK